MYTLYYNKDDVEMLVDTDGIIIAKAGTITKRLTAEDVLWALGIPFDCEEED